MSCVKVEVAVLGSPSLTVLMVSVDLKATFKADDEAVIRAQELCESGGGRPGLPVPDSPYGLYGSKATLKKKKKKAVRRVRDWLTDWLTRTEQTRNGSGLVRNPIWWWGGEKQFAEKFRPRPEFGRSRGSVVPEPGDWRCAVYHGALWRSVSLLEREIPQLSVV